MKKNKEIQTKKEFDAVEFMRSQRDKITKKISTMSNEEIIQYFKKEQVKMDIKPSA